MFSGLGHDAKGFVSGSDGLRYGRYRSIDQVNVRETDATCIDFDQYLERAGFRNRDLLKLDVLLWLE